MPRIGSSPKAHMNDLIEQEDDGPFMSPPPGCSFYFQSVKRKAMLVWNSKDFPPDIILHDQDKMVFLWESWDFPWGEEDRYVMWESSVTLSEYNEMMADSDEDDRGYGSSASMSIRKPMKSMKAMKSKSTKAMKSKAIRSILQKSSGRVSTLPHSNAKAMLPKVAKDVIAHERPNKKHLTTTQNARHSRIYDKLKTYVLKHNMDLDDASIQTKRVLSTLGYT